MKYENEFFIIPHNYVYILHEHARRDFNPALSIIEGMQIFGFKHHRILGVYTEREDAFKAKLRYELKNEKLQIPRGYIAVTKHKISELKRKRG